MLSAKIVKAKINDNKLILWFVCFRVVCSN